MSAQKKRNHSQGEPASRAAGRPWLAIVIMALVLGVVGLLVFFRPASKGSRNSGETQIATSPAALGSNVSASSPEVTSEDLIDIDRSADALNLGNELLAEGKVAEAIEQY